MPSRRGGFETRIRLSVWKQALLIPKQSNSGGSQARTVASAGVAQLGECLPYKQKVIGSKPVGGSAVWPTGKAPASYAGECEFDSRGCNYGGKEEMFQSQTYGKMNIDQIPDKLLMFYEKNRDYESPIHIIVGTDSQNFSQTKMVSVIAVTCEGHGGIFFYEVTRQPRIMDVRAKLHVETNDSLRVASTLVEQMENDEKYEEMYLNCPIAIHVDAGNSKNGKTRELIPELVGWVRAMGYECEIKPDSYVASTIADRISK